jgi:dihydrofolate synthase/folylpolyglutamate synthase
VHNNVYQKQLDWLFNQFASYQNIGADAYKPDLTRIQELCAWLGNPERDVSFVHVAGTNGKGTVSSMLASILTESNRKVGLFTSPHIIDFRERIRVNGECISESDVIAFCSKFRSIECSDRPSFFELTFAMALWYFQLKRCDVCVIETGLGGRLDATNVITPLLSIITNISLDHTDLLGETEEEIAMEKAGIIKEGIPVIIGRKQEKVSRIFHTVSRKKQALIYFASEEITQANTFEFPLLGSHQQENFQTVLCAVEKLNDQGFGLTADMIQLGLDRLHDHTGYRGRMQVVGRNPLVIVDVAHNPAGIKSVLTEMSRLNTGTLHIIYGSSSDKDFATCISLFPNDAKISFCGFSSNRSWSSEDMKRTATLFDILVGIHSNINECFEQVRAQAAPEDSILIFGSFFLLTDFFALISCE